MKYIGILLLAGSLMLAYSCKNNTNPSSQDEIGSYYGDKIDGSKSITYEELLKRMETEKEVEATVVGRVEGVCQTKGCWMNIVSTSNPEAEEMFVKFKDYGFFMPKDIAGKDVIMRGKAFKEETTVEELRHYAEDEGMSAEEIATITEPIYELKFMADGVILKQ